MSEQLKTGVIGLGILGSQHVRFLEKHSETKVVAVADIRGDRAREIGSQVGAQPYEDYVSMLKDQTLDIVVVATPDAFHKDPVLAAIRAGAPTIILEKPMATITADAEEMFEAAERAGARMFVNYANRGSALDRATYQVIQRGLLGQVIYGDVHLDDNISVPTRMWGARTKDWVGASSTAHFLLSHVVDFLRWVLSPSEVSDVYAISQRRVLGYTPDLYDAFLTFDSGAKFRVKAEWIKHIDGLVEFALSFSGSEGSLSYIKRPGFGEVEGWRANVSERLSPHELFAFQNDLAGEGINVRALLHRPDPTAGELKAGGGDLRYGLEAFAAPLDSWRVVRSAVDAVLEDTLTPSSWDRYGPLPTGIDGLRQTQVVAAIVESAERDAAIRLPA
ncbi:MAG: Gfo/Idh/MocA family oxidoreductase [Anaerolineae bacterium]|nr:Gfo/Idh/MocA family oxidoreductase [Anaerolineae bacterium]